jgi:transcriptional regulator GlxA family with amidase domain
MHTILILALDGVMASSLAITLDTLRTGSTFQQREKRPREIRILTAGHKKTVITGGGLRLSVDITFDEVLKTHLKPDWIIVPGLGLVTEQTITERFTKRDAINAMRILQHINTGKTKIGASCSAVFLLAQAGLLSEHHVTMTWWLAQIFRTQHPNVQLDESKMLVRDGHILTAGSAFAQLDLTLAVVADTMSASAAHLCSRYLLIDERPSQARYMIQSHIQHSDPTVIAAERWIDEHLDESISVAELASELAVSPKTLARRIEAATGVSPVKFIQRRRLLQAAHLLETTPMPIETIAGHVGYQDGTALRKLIKREFGVTPGMLR